jgi:hypothetical protein
MPASQAGRRRFDPGRPLQEFLNDSGTLASSAGARAGRGASASPTYHPFSAGSSVYFVDSWPSSSPPGSMPREARGAARAFAEIGTAIRLERVFLKVRRSGERRARRTFAAIIYPERFVEPQKADAGLRAGKPSDGETTSGYETLPCVGSHSRGDEAMGVRGTAWRSARSAERVRLV